MGMKKKFKSRAQASRWPYTLKMAIYLAAADDIFGGD